LAQKDLVSSSLLNGAGSQAANIATVEQDNMTIQRLGSERHEQEKAKQPRHDVLLIHDQPDGTKGSRLERFRVDKVTGVFQDGPQGDKPPVSPLDEGYRPMMNLGSTGNGTAEDPTRGPVLSALPLHPSPAASNGTTCYLVNAQNLDYTTPWTAEEWNDRPGGYDAVGYARPDCFSLLIASPAGKVYYLEKKVGPKHEHIPVQKEGSFIFHEVEMRLESEIWMQLRNGCVVGNVIYEKKPTASSRREKVVPLVNIDSLTPKVPEEKAP
jgi:hypothetical protein